MLVVTVAVGSIPESVKWMFDLKRQLPHPFLFADFFEKWKMFILFDETLIFTLKIYVANIFRFLWWMVNELSFTSKVKNSIGSLDKQRRALSGCGWLY